MSDSGILSSGIICVETKATPATHLIIVERGYTRSASRDTFSIYRNHSIQPRMKHGLNTEKCRQKPFFKAGKVISFGECFLNRPKWLFTA
ncbi:MAG TPA: hypothetical protein VG754_05010, partial [Verrucomicrobiae bacterium]|nr:hypothetical protein [Verrucomicrobiae bacterium]